MAVVPRSFGDAGGLARWVLKRGDCIFIKVLVPHYLEHIRCMASQRKRSCSGIPQGLGSYSRRRANYVENIENPIKMVTRTGTCRCSIALPATIIYQHGIVIGQYDYATHH